MTGNYFIINGDIYRVQTDDLELNNIRPQAYEVIRLINGIPLFIEHHFSRLQNSCLQAGHEVKLDLQSVEEAIRKLSEINHVDNGNLKLIYLLNSKGVKYTIYDYYIFFIPHYYPTATEYRTGVNMCTLGAERPTPNAKISNPDLRKQADNLITEKKVFEVLLVDRDGFVTEGSRSNILFLSGREIYSPPEKVILPGITREMVKQLCNDLNCLYVEKMIHLHDLQTFDAAFISGTSPKILPVYAINNHHFRTDDPVMRELMEAYDQLINRYIESKR